MEYTGDLQKTKWVAASFAKNAKPGDVFCLTGDLGAGKTEFARAFIQSLNGDVKVISPTYNIVQIYDGNIFHFDLYRIKHEDELEEIGFTESIKTGICIIEWPQIAKNFLPKNTQNIEIQIISDEERKIICS